MPELPEVEVIRQSLNKRIKQKRVKKVIVRNRNLRFKIPLKFQKFLENQNSSFCILHLGMSGTIHLVETNNKNSFTNTSFYNSPTLPDKHNHFEIIFSNFKVVYNDPRRFGFLQIIPNSFLLKKRFSRYGPEPFESKFNLNYVFSFFRRKKKNIKNFLLDQNFVSGIGNIYASEILYLSKINPNKKAFLLNKKDCNKIIINSIKLLELNQLT